VLKQLKLFLGFYQTLRMQNGLEMIWYVIVRVRLHQTSL